MKSKQSRENRGGLSSWAVNWIALAMILLYAAWKAWNLYSASDNLIPIIAAGAVWVIGLIFLLTKTDRKQRLARPFWTNVPALVVLLFLIHWIFLVEPDLEWARERLVYLAWRNYDFPKRILMISVIGIVVTFVVRRFIPNFRYSLVGILLFCFIFGSFLFLMTEEISLRTGFVPFNLKALLNTNLLSQIPYYLYMIPVLWLFRELHGYFIRQMNARNAKTDGLSATMRDLRWKQLVFDFKTYKETWNYRALFKAIFAFAVVGAYTVLMNDPLSGKIFGWGFGEALPSVNVAWPALIAGVLIFLDRNTYRKNLVETKALTGRMVGYSLLAFASYVLMCQWLVKSANLYVYMFGIPIVSILIEVVIESRILKACRQGTKPSTANTLWMDYEPVFWIIGILALFAVGTMLNFMPRYLLLVFVIILLYFVLNAILNSKNAKSDHANDTGQLRLQTAVNNFWGAAFVMLLLAARNPQLLSPDLSNYDLIDLYVLNPKIWIAIGLIVLWFIVSGSFYRIANTKVKSRIRGLKDYDKAIDYQTWMNASQIKNAIVLFMAVLLILVFIINEFKSYPVNFLTEPERSFMTLYYPEEEDSAGSRYRLVNDGLSFEEAESRCEQAGGHLAVVTSEEENNLITSLLYGSAVKNCYLLGARQNEYGTFEWITGDPFTYSHWSSGEPNNEEEDILMIYGKGTDSGSYVGEWNDTMDYSEIDFYGIEDLGYICEWEADVPMPSDEELYDIFGVDVLSVAKEAEAERLQNLYDLMAAGDLQSALRASNKINESLRDLYGIDHLIYIPAVTDEDGLVTEDPLNGTGVGIYQKYDMYGQDFYTVYYGEYKNGLRSGTGTELVRCYLVDDIDYVYEGSWLLDKPNGDGRETFTILTEREDGLDSIVTEGSYVNGQYYGKHTTTWKYRQDAALRRITEECSFGYGRPLGKLLRHVVYTDGTKYDLTAYYRDGQPEGAWKVDYTSASGEKFEFHYEVQDGRIAEGAYQNLVADHGDKIRVSMNENGFIANYEVRNEEIYCLTYPDPYCLTWESYTPVGLYLLMK